MKIIHHVPSKTILIFIFLISCGQTKNRSLNIKGQGVYKIEDILGPWGNDASTGNAEFSFYKDSIYYPDPNTWYKYSISKDTIILDRENDTIEKILIKSVSKDSITLNYLDINTIESYRRRK